MLHSDSIIYNFRMSNIRLGITSTTDMNLGRAVLVEDCSCPPGYTGTSCEVCRDLKMKDAGTGYAHGNCIKDCKIVRILFGIKILETNVWPKPL